MPEQQNTFGEIVGLPDIVAPAAYTPSDERVEGRDFNSCVGCGDEFDCDDTVTNDTGDVYCNDCYYERFTECVDCACEVDTEGDSYISNESGDSYCMPCYDNAYTRCDACGGETSNNEIERVNGRDYCNGCYSDRFTTCCGCADVMAFDDVAYTDEYDGESYCADCAPSDEDDDSAEWNKGRNVEGVTFDKIGSRRRFGVELEISGCTGHSGLRGNTVFGAKYDGSLTSGKEFVSPVLGGDEGIAAIENLCAYGKTHKWSVDNSCGYHVHIDCSDYGNDQLHAVAVGYSVTEALWKRFVSKKRGENSYCRKFGNNPQYYLTTNFQRMLSNTDCRYYWLNWQAYNQHQTVEIRLHSGTVNADKVVNWVKAHARFVEYCAGKTAQEVYDLFNGKTVEEQFTVMAEIWGNDGLADYYAARAAKHGHPVIVEQPAQVA